MFGVELGPAHDSHVAFEVHQQPTLADFRESILPGIHATCAIRGLQYSREAVVQIMADNQTRNESKEDRVKGQNREVGEQGGACSSSTHDRA